MMPTPARFPLFILIALAFFVEKNTFAADDSLMLEEVIVTAQKREESLQELPIAVSVFNADMLNDTGITHVSEIAMQTPGFAMGQFNMGQPQFYIRGIGSNEEGPGGDPSVVVFVDEVYLGRPSASAFELFDLQRIEILRGPQGTLFGKNASGGAINVVTKKPSDSFSSKLRMKAGNIGQKGFDGYVTGPIAVPIAASFAFSHNQHDGYVTSIVNGEEFQDKNATAARASFRYFADEDLEILFSADMSSDDAVSSGRKPRGGALEATLEALYPGISAQHYTTGSEFPGLQDRTLWGTNLRINLDTDFALLTSITAYRQSEWHEATDILGMPVINPANFFIANFVDEDADQFSQELRLSNIGDGLLTHWVVGIFYMHEETLRREEFPLNSIDDSQDWDTIIGDGETDNYAIFAQATWALHEHWQLVTGIRYTRDDKKIAWDGSGGIAFIPEPYSAENEDSWSEPTYKLSLDYRPNDNWMTYFSYATGFKSGGFPGQPANEFAALSSFEPELSSSFEVGFKGDYFDNSLRVNLAIFSAIYKDFQELLTIIDPDTGLLRTLTTNAAEVGSDGVELELNWLIGGDFLLTGTAAYLDSTYNAYTDHEERVGKQTRNAPKNSYSLAGDYRLSLSEARYLNFRLEYAYKDIAYQEPDNVEKYAIPEYALINAIVAFKLDDAWEFTAWVKNLAEEEYLAHNYPLPLTEDGPGISGFPRMYGLSVNYNFAE
ncbi:MAG: TonB-dependent receptor [Pseudomonadales bacterium]|nr:TonB-dependent receptor [Pseudomonadales bacterium]